MTPARGPGKPREEPGARCAHMAWPQKGAEQMPGGTSHEDSLLPDELAVHGDQPEVHLEQELEHTQLLPQVPLSLRAVAVDGDEQAFSELWAQQADVSQPPGSPLTCPDPWGQLGDDQVPGNLIRLPMESREEGHRPQDHTLTS